MSIWTILWLIIGAAGVTTEVVALRVKGHKGTLTQTLQRAFLSHGKVVRWVSYGAWFGFAFWFSRHIWG